MDPIFQEESGGSSPLVDRSDYTGRLSSSERPIQEPYPQPSLPSLISPPQQYQPSPQQLTYSYPSPYATSPPILAPNFPNTSYWNPYSSNGNYPSPPILPLPSHFPNPTMYPEMQRDMTYPTNSTKSVHYNPTPEPPSPIVPISIGIAITLVGMATIRWLNGEDFILFPTFLTITSDHALLGGESSSPQETTSNLSFNKSVSTLYRPVESSSSSSFHHHGTSSTSTTKCITTLNENDHPAFVQPIKELTTAIQKLSQVHEKLFKLSSDAAGKAVTDDVMGLLLQKKKKTHSNQNTTTTHGENIESMTHTHSTTNINNNTATTDTATFAYSWFLLQQILKVKTNIQSIKLAVQQMKDKDEVRDLIEKVMHISTIMVQMERILVGQDIPATLNETLEISSATSKEEDEGLNKNM